MQKQITSPGLDLVYSEAWVKNSEVLSQEENMIYLINRWYTDWGRAGRFDSRNAEVQAQDQMFYQVDGH